MAEANGGANNILKSSFVWTALAVLVAGAVGAIGAYTYVQGQIDDRVRERVEIEVPKALIKKPNMIILEKTVTEIHETQQELGKLQGELRSSLAKSDAAAEQALARAAELEDRAKEVGDAIDLEKVLSRVDDLTTEALRNLDDVLVARVSLPPGTILAFALPRPTDVDAGSPSDDPCPTDWTRYREADGRVVVGVGTHREGLAPYTPFQKDGERNHELTVDEMPTHAHQTIHQFMQAVGSGGSNRIALMQDGVSASSRTTISEKVGMGVPHNNMPPYIALYFCKKS